MPKQLNYILTQAEQTEIEQAIQSEKRAAVRQRATALRMLHLGYQPNQVAEVMQVGLSSLYNWHQRWREGGLTALADRPKSGRRRKTTPAYWQALEQALEQDPTRLGYLFTVWTLERLRDHLAAQTGISLSIERLRVQMQEAGYVWRRPKHDLHALQDPTARAEALALLEGLKKVPKPQGSSYSMWTKVP